VKLLAGLISFVVVFALALITVAGDQGSAVPAVSVVRGLAPMPASFRGLYLAAAGTCPGLPPEILMAIGEVESGHGANDGPSSAGAVGPMQFEPSTFAAYASPVPSGGANPPSPWDPTDAIYAAARDLCANGGLGGADIPGAIFTYNHSRAYVAEVLSVAARYTAQDAATATVTATATAGVS
jgi:membrane-bound lytic murein transglycosylase B